MSSSWQFSSHQGIESVCRTSNLIDFYNNEKHTGEEMTHYTMNLILDAWIRPHIDIEHWKFYDLSCKARDETDDKVLHDAVAAGKAVCSIFKEPTITPSALQVKVSLVAQGEFFQNWTGFL